MQRVAPLFWRLYANYYILQMLSSLYSQSFKNTSDHQVNKDLLQKYHQLTAQIKDHKLAIIDIVFNEDDLKEFEKLAQKISQYKKVLVLGVGGSSLGGKTLTSLKFQNKLQFLESIDPATVHNTLNETDLRNTFFLVISKSGETIETICQTLVLLDKLHEEKITGLAKRFLFITESKQNSIAKIASEIGAEIFPHPQEIGGRYSCFSVVGLLPALLCGTNIAKIRLGARKILAHFLEGENNEILKSCEIQLELYRQGFNSNVVMPYIDNLKNFTDWYRQLWAESLGKNHFGSTPINSMGTVDQHSQLQLYLDGPKNKFFTFFTQRNHPQNFYIKDQKNCPTLFGGKKLSEIVDVEQATTIEVLNQQKLPIRIFEIDQLDEEVLGGLMMQMFLEVILIAEYKGIQAFDQPAVELRKNLARKILQR